MAKIQCALKMTIIEHLKPDTRIILKKILGSHVYGKNGTRMPLFVPNQSFDKTISVKVWRLVEKKTDVNIAISMYRDVNRGDINQIVLFSNDTDAEPAIKALTEDFPALKIGLIMPITPHISEKKTSPSKC